MSGSMSSRGPGWQKKKRKAQTRVRKTRHHNRAAGSLVLSVVEVLASRWSGSSGRKRTVAVEAQRLFFIIMIANLLYDQSTWGRRGQTGWGQTPPPAGD